MTRDRWTAIAASLGAAAGAAWIAKFAVIVATDGAEDGAGSAVASTLYLLAVTLVLVGSTWVGTLLAGDRPWPVLALLVAVSPIVAIVSYGLIDAVVKPAVGDAGPSWLGDEAGILVTGVVWLASSLAVLRSVRIGQAEAAHP